MFLLHRNSGIKVRFTSTNKNRQNTEALNVAQSVKYNRSDSLSRATTTRIYVNWEIRTRVSHLNAATQWVTVARVYNRSASVNHQPATWKTNRCVLVGSRAKAFPGRATNYGSTLPITAHLVVIECHHCLHLALRKLSGFSQHAINPPRFIQHAAIPAPTQPTIVMTKYTHEPTVLNTSAFLAKLWHFRGSSSGVCEGSITTTTTTTGVKKLAATVRATVQTDVQVTAKLASTVTDWPTSFSAVQE